MTRLKFKRNVEKILERFERIDGDKEEWRRPFFTLKFNDEDKNRSFSVPKTEGRPHTLLNRFLLNNRQMYTFEREVNEEDTEKETMNTME